MTVCSYFDVSMGALKLPAANSIRKLSHDNSRIDLTLPRPCTTLHPAWSTVLTLIIAFRLQLSSRLALTVFGYLPTGVHEQSVVHAVHYAVKALSRDYYDWSLKYKLRARLTNTGLAHKHKAGMPFGKYLFLFLNSQTYPSAMIYPILLVHLAVTATAHAGHEQTVLGPHQSLWYNALPGDGGTQVSSSNYLTPIF